jgi:hypothetical protein
LGKAGRAVRLQAPTKVEDAIAKAIAYEMETSHAGQVFMNTACWTGLYEHG